MVEKRFYTPEELETITGISRGVQAVFRCTNRHNIPFTKIGRKVLYPIDQIERWLKERTVNADQQD
jgi:predicted DNA-binding transcriptional regulator AlpA